MNIIKKAKVAVATAAALGVVAMAAPAMATVIATAKDTNNFTFSSGTPVLLSTGSFSVNAGDTVLVSFSAECAVGAAVNSFTSWTDVDIQLLNASSGAVVAVLAPTVGTADAFCTSNGSAATDGWVMASVTGFHNFASVGPFIIRVVAHLNNGATEGWYGDRSLVVWK